MPGGMTMSFLSMLAAGDATPPRPRPWSCPRARKVSSRVTISSVMEAPATGHAAEGRHPPRLYPREDAVPAPQPGAARREPPHTPALDRRRRPRDAEERGQAEEGEATDPHFAGELCPGRDRVVRGACLEIG